MGALINANAQRVEFVDDKMDGLIDQVKKGAEDMEETGWGPATFDEMDIAVDNITVNTIINYLNKQPLYSTFSYLMDYAFQEMRTFCFNGARLKAGHLKQFFEIVLDSVDSRAYSVRNPISDYARRNIDLIKSKANNIDAEFCKDMNDYFDNYSDEDPPFDLYKYTNIEEETKMEDNEKKIKETVDSKEVVENDENPCTCHTTGYCQCGDNVEGYHEPVKDEFPDEDDFACLEGEACCGHVYNAPVINFNAPIITLCPNADGSVIDQVRDLLLDFYNTHD